MFRWNGALSSSRLMPCAPGRDLLSWDDDFLDFDAGRFWPLSLKNLRELLECAEERRHVPESVCARLELFVEACGFLEPLASLHEDPTRVVVLEVEELPLLLDEIE